MRIGDATQAPGNNGIASILAQPKIIGAVSALALIIILSYYLPVMDSVQEFLEWVQNQGVGGVLVFILVYIISTVLFLPAVILTVGAGFIYGTILASLYVEIGATVGACISFLLGKLLFRDCVLKLVDTYPMFSAIDKAVTLNSWKIVTLLRLSPLTPYNVLNYALSLTRIKFWDYTVSSALGMIPSTVLFAYLGTAAKNIADIVNNEHRESSVLDDIMFYGGLVVTIISVVMITVISGKAIKEELRAVEQKKTGPKSTKNHSYNSV